jgi:hypothetical protein
MPNPYVEESAFWEAALEHYHWDRMDQAFARIQQRGIGDAGVYHRWYRVIEAEAISRKYSRQQPITDWLSFEFVPDELDGMTEELTRRTLDACDEVAERLGWDHGVETHVAVLSEAADGPWAANPYGYCVEKEPYFKICLPSYLVEDLEEFSQAVAHEYAHVISTNLSDGHAPRWLEEAVSVLAERSLSPEAWEVFARDEQAWLDPDELELRLESRGDEESNGDEVWMAYQQCGWIGRYIASFSGEKRLGDLLREHTNESLFRNLRLAFQGKGRVDGAIEKVLGMSTPALFSQSLDYLRKNGP